MSSTRHSDVRDVSGQQRPGGGGWTAHRRGGSDEHA